MKRSIGIVAAAVALGAAGTCFGIGLWLDMPVLYGIAIPVFLIALSAFLTVWIKWAKRKRSDGERARLDARFAEDGCTVLLWYGSYGKPYDLRIPRRGKRFTVEQYEDATVRELIVVSLFSDEDSATYVSDGVKQTAKANSADELMEILDKSNVSRKMTEVELLSLRRKKFVLDKELYSHFCAAKPFRAEYGVFMAENEFVAYEIGR